MILKIEERLERNLEDIIKNTDPNDLTVYQYGELKALLVAIRCEFGPIVDKESSYTQSELRYLEWTVSGLIKEFEKNNNIKQ